VDIKEKMDLFGQEIELNMVENNGKGGTTSRILLIIFFVERLISMSI
jgi:hypothetical protein